MKTNQEYSGLEIAIIGMSCRLPGAGTHEEFWKNLSEGRESIKFLSDEDLLALGADETILGDENFVRASPVMDNKDCFDYSFFEYRPDEAKLLNPEHRIFHECVWEALEDAGYNPEQTKGLIGMYAGAGQDLNWRIYSKLMNNNNGAVDDFLLDKINDKDFLTSLLSYKLDLKGPSFSVQTACSTSLVAIHLACKSLLLGEAKMALAGGVRIYTSQQNGYMYEEGSVQSKDGHCRAFDSNCSGTVFSEGAGVVVLKRLKDAISDNDHIYAIIKGSAINNDGKRKVGYTAPSVEGQAECIRMAQKFARVSPETISYVEAHGTATALGDPIEIEALNMAFNKSSEKTCAVGSVKTNIGHADTAAGVAGLIKTALSLRHKQIPPSLFFNEANPEIDFDGGPFYVNTSLAEWQRNGSMPLRAGVSSMGIGGTNAHIILEEAPQRGNSSETRNYTLLSISARSENALKRYADKLTGFLSEHPLVNLADMAYTLQTGRRAFDYRKTLVFSSREELMQLLSDGRLKEQINRSNSKSTAVFMFPGAGSQYAGMGKDLYETEPVFRQEIDKGLALLKTLTGIDYKDILYPASANDTRVNNMLHTQPMIFLFEYALAQLLISHGIKPGCMMGHSIGEYVAACISGVFSYNDALKLVIRRGELMNSMPAGAMVSVALTEAEALPYTNSRVSLAAVNSADQVVFSGDVEAIDLLTAELERQDIQLVRLHASHAGHSPTIEAVLSEYRDTLNTVTMHAPQIPFVSNYTAQLITEEEATSADYWLKHMRHTVKFYDSVNTLLADGSEKIFIEAGAGHSLTSLLKQHKTNKGTVVSVNLVRSIKEKENDQKYFTDSLGRLWSNGLAIDWHSYYQNETRSRIPLPTYAFEPDKFPTVVDPFKAMSSGQEPGFSDPSGNKELKDWIYYPAWKSTIQTTAAGEEGTRTYLVFSSGSAFFTTVRKELATRAAGIVEVLSGETFIKHSKKKYTINATQAGHFKQLLQELEKDSISVTDIAYGWGMGCGISNLVLQQNNKELHLLYFAFATLVQELKAMQSLSKKRFVVITDSLHRVTGSEVIAFKQSLLLGIANALPQEYSVSCRNIDISMSQKTPNLARQLVAELYAEETMNNRVVALRHGQKWIRDFQKNTQTFSDARSPLKKGGVYLITGGLGNVGFVLAKHLVQHYDATLIIVGRKNLDNIAALPEENTSDAAKRLAYLHSISDNIIYARTDVTSHSSLKQAIAIAESKTGTIHGVIHTAGIVDFDMFELIEDISYQKTHNMLSPKIEGLHAIYEIFKERELDFVWITSSMASLLAGLSFSAYSAANLYLDHFIYSKCAHLPNWRSVNLAEMLFEETGIKNEKKNARSAMKPEEICSLFEWSLSLKDVPVVMETAIDLHSRIYKVYGEKKDVYFDGDPGYAIEKTERPNLKNPYVPADTDSEKKLVGILSDFFGIENIGIEDNFFELGGDSLKAMVLLKRIKKDLNVSLGLKEFFAAPTLRDAAAQIDNIMWLKADVKMNNEIII